MQNMSEINHAAASNLDPSIARGLALSVMMIGFLLLLLLKTLIIRKIFGLKPRLVQRLPPGPKGWPLVGCLFHFKTLFSAGFQDWVKKYGPIITLPILSTPMIFIADADLVHEAFVEKGLCFASRPCIFSAALSSSNYRSINMGLYGPVWRTLRKNLVRFITSASKVSDFENLKEEVVQDLLRKFRDEAARNGGSVQVRQICSYGFFDYALSLCFGKRPQERLLLEVAQLMKKILLRSRSGIDDFVPWLRFVPWIRTKEHQELRQQQVNIMLPLIKEAERLRNDGKLSSSSYIDSLLSVDLQGQKLSEDELLTLCSELLNAATDTISTTLEWAMANIINQPNIQAQIVSEIERVVGKRAVKEEDLDNLPYLEAVVMETLRRHPPGYFTLPHVVTQPCKLQEYDIPLNANVFACIFSISNNPRVWGNPTEFKPDRFLNLVMDITGSKKITIIPFGTGRRICPGLRLALLNLKFILARLIQSFEWSTTVPDETVDLTGTMEFVMVMKSPLRALIQNRL